MIILDFTTHRLYGTVYRAREADFTPDAGDSDGSCLNMLYETIGCRGVEAIPIARGIEMWVDEDPAGRDDSAAAFERINWLATMLRTAYWAKSKGNITIPATDATILGTAVLLGIDRDGECVDLTREQVAYVKSLMDVEPRSEAAPEA